MATRRTVEFEFDVKDHVMTRFGDGYITSLSINESGTLCYYVERKETGRWEKGDTLELITDDTADATPVESNQV